MVPGWRSAPTPALRCASPRRSAASSASGRPSGAIRKAASSRSAHTRDTPGPIARSMADIRLVDASSPAATSSPTTPSPRAGCGSASRARYFFDGADPAGRAGGRRGAGAAAGRRRRPGRGRDPGLRRAERGGRVSRSPLYETGAATCPAISRRPATADDARRDRGRRHRAAPTSPASSPRNWAIRPCRDPAYEAALQTRGCGCRRPTPTTSRGNRLDAMIFPTAILPAAADRRRPDGGAERRAGADLLHLHPQHRPRQQRRHSRESACRRA